MAFKREASTNVTTVTVIGGYSVPASTTAIIFGLMIANMTASAATVTVDVYDGAAIIATILKSANIPVGATLVPVGGEARIALQTGDRIRVTSDQPVDILMSFLESAV